MSTFWFLTKRQILALQITFLRKLLQISKNTRKLPFFVLTIFSHQLAKIFPIIVNGDLKAFKSWKFSCFLQHFSTVFYIIPHYSTIFDIIRHYTATFIFKNSQQGIIEKYLVFFNNIQHFLKIP